MGPYCNFCQRRCFVMIRDDDPIGLRQAYLRRGINLLATCQRGIEHDKQQVGWSLEDRIEAYQRAGAVGQARPAEPGVTEMPFRSNVSERDAKPQP